MGEEAHVPWAIWVGGRVQGVGFRPYVWQLAHALGLSGRVWNDAQGVCILIDGRVETKTAFLARLTQTPPPLARIASLKVMPAPHHSAGPGFAIAPSQEASQTSPSRTPIGPDAALCLACIAELCDPLSRRWRYPFISCTHCGPRYSVTRRLPYDRPHTSVAPFALCPACLHDYTDPASRHFHAQTTGCPVCGPRLSLHDAHGAILEGDPIKHTLSRLYAGQCVAIKGVGGFHLACLADQTDAVARLRASKQRDAKPFALMALNEASLADWVHIGPAQARLLRSHEAPIVLCPSVGPARAHIAPGLDRLGVMLPSTPLHLLLWHEALGRPSGTAWCAAPSSLVLVMTSANPHSVPLVYENTDAFKRLQGMADAFLVHDRAIVAPCDDSVVLAGAQGPVFIRRARGYVPEPIALAEDEDGPCVLALGAQLKNTFCLLKGREAFLSPHLGSLNTVATLDAHAKTLTHWLDLLEVRPEWLAHDRHPDMASTQLALRLAQEWAVPALPVGHHHAHVAAVCAEHGLSGPVMGLALDGVGLGEDGTAWGGELVWVEGHSCTRLGHLRPLAMPGGGDCVAREPWRMAVSALHAVGLGAEARARFASSPATAHKVGPILGLLDRGAYCPPTTSLGRWFDAAAALLGVCAHASYEGQAAMQLEALAGRAQAPLPDPDGFYTVTQTPASPGLWVLDLCPLVPVLAKTRDVAWGAALFHAVLAHGLVAWVSAALSGHSAYKCQTPIVVSGGCALNQRLMAALESGLAARGLCLLQARQAPPNDGGLSLGQAWVARAFVRENAHYRG